VDPARGDGSTAVALEPAPAEPEALPLVVALARALEEAGVACCHFKSNEALDRSLRGENDLDLLIGAEGTGPFLEVLARLGFKEAHVADRRRVPGVTQYYGLDEPSGRLVQVHLHRRLVMGDHTTKNLRLDIEAEYLAAAVPGPLFRVPRPEHELILFVLRMVVKHCTPDAMLMLQGRLSASERRELTWLLERTSLEGVARSLEAALPNIERDLFERCLRAIRPGAGVWFRSRTAGRLLRAVSANARRGRAADAALRVWRRTTWGVRRLVRGPSRKRPAGGGVLVAIVGGDGSGKSTAVTDLAAWLGGTYATRTVHLGKPPPHVLTLLVKGPMAALRRLGVFRNTRVPAYRLEASGASFPGHAWLVWNVLTARDRYLAYRRARRFVLGGGLVVSDRMPLSVLRTMDGPRTSWLGGEGDLGRAARWLIAREASYYARIRPPDVLIVLRVDPEVAVLRVTGGDEPGFVRDRNAEILRVDWSETSAVVIDATRPLQEVRSLIRGAVWSRL
jgi:thymidylate kinase